MADTSRGAVRRVGECYGELWPAADALSGGNAANTRINVNFHGAVTGVYVVNFYLKLRGYLNKALKLAIGKPNQAGKLSI